MSGQGIHKAALAEEQRLTAWAQVSGRERFTAADLAVVTGMSPEWARKVIREWQLDGMIVEVDRDGQTAVWRPLEDSAQETAYGRESRRPEFAMWRTMRSLRKFSAGDVHLTANTETTPLTISEIQKYCTALAEAEVLKVAVKAGPGKRAPVYAVQGRPGPFAPRVVRVSAVFDPNTQTFRVLDKRVRP